MAQAMINFRIDENIKKEMEKICREMGMSMTTAFTIFATKVTKEKKYLLKLLQIRFILKVI